MEESLLRAKRTLFEERKKKPLPLLDEKILTSINGMMIVGLVQASHVLVDKKYLEKAVSVADFVKKYLFDEKKGLLWRSYRSQISILQLFFGNTEIL